MVVMVELRLAEEAVEWVGYREKGMLLKSLESSKVRLVGSRFLESKKVIKLVLDKKGSSMVCCINNNKSNTSLFIIKLSLSVKSNSTSLSKRRSRIVSDDICDWRFAKQDLADSLTALA